MPPDAAFTAPCEVLITTDDAAVVEGLQRRLQPLPTHWNLTFTRTGQEALAALARTAHDVIVCDAVLPDMDGAQLLQQVSERWPSLIRIAFSSPSETEQKVRLLPLAHQFLGKPCRTEQLAETISRSLRLRDELGSPAVRALVGRVRQLPVRPAVFSRLRIALARPGTTGREVSDIIGSDTALTAKVLQLANSAFFRRARRITSIEQAVLYLGFSAVHNLVLCGEVFGRWPGQLRHAAVDLVQLQEHAVHTAAVAGSITAGLQCANDTVLSALLHDIGYLLLVQECPRELEQAMELALAAGISLPQAEQEILGASHAVIGAYLLGLWGLPHAVVEAVAHHHDPEGRTGEFDALAALAVAIALTGEDDSHGGARPLAPIPVVGPEFLDGLASPWTWDEAGRRAAECLTTLAEGAD